MVCGAVVRSGVLEMLGGRRFCLLPLPQWALGCAVGGDLPAYPLEYGAASCRGRLTWIRQLDYYAFGLVGSVRLDFGGLVVFDMG